jgi:hypothetical protein
MRARRALALLVVVGILAGAGGAARASSHHATPRSAVKFGVFQALRPAYLQIAGRDASAIAGVSVPPGNVNDAQAGTVVVTDTSATTGPPPHIVRIPVQLSP